MNEPHAQHAATPTADNPYLGDLERHLPFDRFGAEHIEPAVMALLAEAEVNLALLRGGDPTWAATFGALDALTVRLETAVGIVDHLESVLGDPAIRAAYTAVRPAISAFYSKLGRDAALFATLEHAAATSAFQALTGPERRYIDTTLDAFRRSGVALAEGPKARLDAIDVALAEITNRFSQNTVDATDAFTLDVTDVGRLAGLPQGAIDAAQATAKAAGVEGWRLNLRPPTLTAVLTYADDRGLREALYRAYNSRGTAEPYDNRALIAEILELRREKAELLGYTDHADLVLEPRMVKSGAAARRFVDGLRARTEAAFAAEQQALDAFYRSQVPADAPDLGVWDLAYWAEKQRAAEFAFDEEALRPYFSAAGVMRGMFELVGRLYGVTVSPLPEAPVWHADVEAFALVEADGTRIGQFYVDLFPRQGKRSGAWMRPLVTGDPSNGVPHMGLMCANLTPPLGEKPALLTHREVETLFHEFGHLLHHLLTTCDIRSQAGTNVAWDFVELPSQIMENWCWHREALDLFARHYETGAPIPDDLFDRLSAARTFRAASAQMRQLGFATVDLALHREFVPPAEGDAGAAVLEYAREHGAAFVPVPVPGDYAMIASFSHLFSSPVAYAAGYYSYKWAEVLDADAFTRFVEGGLFSAEVGDAFRRAILSQGDSADPAALYRAFMGRDPDPEALLRRCGLASEADDPGTGREDDGHAAHA